MRELAEKLNLIHVSAPLFLASDTGLNDNLNVVERAVSFDIKEYSKQKFEVVLFFAKWKRMVLKSYAFAKGEGLYTDMNAIRCDEKIDNIHSIYVDQWDWEKVIGEVQASAWPREIIESLNEYKICLL